MYYPVNGGPGHVKGPGHYPVGGGAGKPEKITRVEISGPQPWSYSVPSTAMRALNDSGEAEVHPQVTVAIEV